MAKQHVPWSVKGVSPEARRMAKEQAQARGITIGEWLSEAIDFASQRDAHQEEVVEADPYEAALDQDPASQRARELVEPLEDVLGVIVDRLNKLEKRAGGDR